LKVALDSNVLAYAEGIDDPQRQAAARALIDRLPEEGTLIPAQALGELYNVLVRKGRWRRDRARNAVVTWRDNFAVGPTSEAAIIAALDLAADHRLGMWDSVMISVAAECGCRLLLSEDLQDGFTWRGITVANPFAPRQHPLLGLLLSEAGDGEDK
jgi:predicted nucleic acid-binding protein